MSKSIKNLMSLGIGILSDFIEMLVRKWKQVGTKNRSKIDVNFERRFFDNCALAVAGTRFFRFGRSKWGANIDQKMKSTWDGLTDSIFLGF